MLAITSLIKNRAWCLPYFLGCIAHLQHPKDDTRIILLDDASTDGSTDLLRAWCTRAKKAGYASVDLIIKRDGIDHATSARDTTDRKAGYPHLAALRNEVVDTVLAYGCDWQLSIDSDILVSPGIVAGLMAHQLPYVSSIIFNDIDPACGTGRIAMGVPIINRYTNAGGLFNGRWRAMSRYEFGRLYPCGYSGAVYLAGKAALDSGARFGAHGNIGAACCEDYGYCVDLEAAGLPRHIDTTLRAVHLMVPACLQEGLGVFVAWFGHLPGTPAPERGA